MDKMLARKYLSVLKKYDLRAGQGMNKLGYLTKVNIYEDLTKFWESLGFDKVEGRCCLNEIFVGDIQNFRNAYNEFLKKVL